MRTLVNPLLVLVAGIVGIVVATPSKEHVEVLDEVALTGTASLTYPELNVRHVHCMAHVLYGEVRAEQDDEGHFAVAWVLINRARDNKAYFGGSDICDVSYYKTESVEHGSVKVRWQFDGAKTKIRDQKAWARAVRIAMRALLGEGEPEGEMKYARYFYEPSNSGKIGGGWQQRNTIAIAKIGSHIFGKKKEKQERLAVAR